MKGKDLLILGGVGLAAYFLFFNKKEAVKEALPDMPQMPPITLPNFTLPDFLNPVTIIRETMRDAIIAPITNLKPDPAASFNPVIPNPIINTNYFSGITASPAVGSFFNKKNVIVPAAPKPQYSSIVLNPKTLTFQSPLTTNKLFGTFTNPLFNRK